MLRKFEEYSDRLDWAEASALVEHGKLGGSELGRSVSSVIGAFSNEGTTISTASTRAGSLSLTVFGVSKFTAFTLSTQFSYTQSAKTAEPRQPKKRARYLPGHSQEKRLIIT